MQPHSRHQNRAAVAVISRIVDMLEIEREKGAAPQVNGVVPLDNILASISQPAITEQKAESPEREVLAMIRRNAISTRGDPGPVKIPMPVCALAVRANRNSVIDFSVSK